MTVVAASSMFDYPGYEPEKALRRRVYELRRTALNALIVSPGLLGTRPCS